MNTLNEIWSLAATLASDKANIIQHPRESNRHIVFDHGGARNVWKDKCDSQCANFKANDRFFCEHTIAVAETTGTLPSLLGMVNANIRRKTMETVNTALAHSCRNAGEKSGKKRKGKNNLMSQKVTTVVDMEHTEAQSMSEGQPAMLPIVGFPDRHSLPPLTPLQLSLQDRQPFTVTFRQGLIKRCTGCGIVFAEKQKKPPHDAILKKQDFREYQRDGLWYRTPTMVNTYYHLNVNCLRRKFPGTEVREIILYDDVRQNLLDAHIAILHQFGVHKACEHDEP